MLLCGVVICSMALKNYDNIFLSLSTALFLKKTFNGTK